jgi:DNA-binding transcriptional LysR family regulator
VIRPTEIDDGKVIESILETATMQDLDLNGLRVFREIVESGSFTAAADRLGIAASMVSKHLARLERQLGARLLHRTSRRMSLTEAGSLFHEQNRQALDVLDAAVASVGQASGAPRGELKVSAPVWCATPRFVRM